MKAVTAGLAGALLKRSFRPYVQVKVDNRRNGGVSPTLWYECYTTAIADVGHCAAVVCDGALLDFRCNRGDGKIYMRSTALGEDPGGSWELLVSSVKTDAQIAACSDGTRVYLAWVDADGHTIRWQKSSDNGVHWDTDPVSTLDPSKAFDLGPGHVCRGLAAVCPGEGLHDVLLFVTDAATDDDTTADKTVRWAYFTVTGGWSLATSWGRAAGKSDKGLAAAAFECDEDHSEVLVLAAGKFETLTSGFNLQAYHVSVNDSHAATWTYARVLKQLSSGSNLMAWPSMITEAADDRARVLFQYYDASLPAAKRWQSYQTYVYELVTADDVFFGAWQPFRVTNDPYTLGICRSESTIYAGLADNLWKCVVSDGSSPWYVDVSSSLLAFEHHTFDNALVEDVDFQPGFAYVFLDNHDGRFLDFGQSGETYEAIKRGAQVHIMAGYRTAAGVEVEILPPMWIERIFHGSNSRSGASQDVPHLAVEGGPLLGGKYVILKCYDSWTVLARRGPGDGTYQTNGSPRDTLAHVFAQVGMKYSDDGTDRLSKPGAYPAVTWVCLAGTPWYNLVRDILLYCHCRVKFYVEYTTSMSTGKEYPTARAYVFADRDVDPVDLSVGGSGELGLYAGMYWEQDRWGGYYLNWYDQAFRPTTILQVGAFSGAAVEGKGVSDLEIDFDRAEALGYWQPRPLVDFQLSADTYVTAEDRAKAALEDPLYCGQVLIPVHPCLEVWDRVQITDGGAGQAVQKRFVVGVETFYDVKAKRGRYEQVVHLMRHERS